MYGKLVVNEYVRKKKQNWQWKTTSHPAFALEISNKGQRQSCQYYFNKKVGNCHVKNCIMYILKINLRNEGKRKYCFVIPFSFVNDDAQMTPDLAVKAQCVQTKN